MSKIFPMCKKVIHLNLILGSWVLCAQENSNILIVEQGRSVTSQDYEGRAPASTVPRDDIEVRPYNDDVWLQNIFVEDNAGVLKGMGGQIAEWQRMEDYRNSWDIGSTGLYNTPDLGDKKKWFNRQLLKYADKRLSGEMKSAEKGSALAKVATAQQALKPSTTAAISESVKVKFKARVLQMNASMKVINPWVDSETTFNAQGGMNTQVGRKFASLGVDTKIDYQIDAGVWTASIRKPLSETVTAVVSSSQAGNDMAFTGQSNNTFQLLYYKPF